MRPAKMPKAIYYIELQILNFCFCLLETKRQPTGTREEELITDLLWKCVPELNWEKEEPLNSSSALSSAMPGR